MAREFAPIKLSIWADDDWRELSIGAQHLYLVLLTSKTLSHCGVADWRPVRIAALAKGWTAVMVEESARELAERLYLVVDESTEEVLLRSFIRNDGLMKQPKMAVAMGRAHDMIASSAIRGVVVHELQRLRLDFPELNGWKAEKALETLQMGSVDPSTYPTGYGIKSAEERGPERVSNTGPERVSNGVRERVNADLTEGVPNSLLLSPSSLLLTPDSSAPVAPRKRGTRLPDGWMPQESTKQWARENHPNVNLHRAHEKFSNYWPSVAGAKGIKLDWDKTWRNWIISESERSPSLQSSAGALTKREMELARAEQFKENPNIEILRRAGLEPQQQSITGGV
ncbi:hypothetical protein [Rhodococcus sp. JT-3]|uniref:hypothetical protein n=1 Tax=Rhodococcus sp. JT-3 TaxID=1973213 RepID=UPI0018EF16E6|nr:hypothetical protein [Rhodococcus sp. JT-3]